MKRRIIKEKNLNQQPIRGHPWLSLAARSDHASWVLTYCRYIQPSSNNIALILLHTMWVLLLKYFAVIGAVIRHAFFLSDRQDVGI